MTGKAEIRDRLRGLLDPVVALCNYAGISPMAITATGILLSFLGAVFVGKGNLLTGAVILLLSGLCDTIDGSLARSQNSASRFGAFIDSTGDRVTEHAYYMGLVFYFVGQRPVNHALIFFVLAALGGSFLTSYTRARAEGLGMECKVGLLERPERIALLIIGLVFGGVVLTAVIVVLAAMSVFTSIQRVLHVRNLTDKDAAASDAVQAEDE